jgi:hypothetical protein
MTPSVPRTGNLATYAPAPRRPLKPGPPDSSVSARMPVVRDPHLIFELEEKSRNPSPPMSEGESRRIPMSNRIDCSSMSHAACIPYPDEDDRATQASQASHHQHQPDPALEIEGDDFGQAYDYVNDCMASLGLPSAVAGTVVTVGCLIATAGGCAVLAGGALGALTGACAGLHDLEESR